MAEEDPRPSVDVSTSDVSPLMAAEVDDGAAGGVEDKLWWKVTHA